MIAGKRQQRVNFQWMVGEEFWQAGDGWLDTPSAPPNETATEMRLVLWLARGLTLGLLMLMVSAASFTLHEHEQRTVQAAIAPLVTQELTALHTDDQSLYQRQVDNRNALLDTTSWLDPWRLRMSQRKQISLTLLDVTLLPATPQAEMAQAAVLVVPPVTHWVSVPYVETRFYQKQGQRWLRIVPPPAFWGDLVVVETGLLRFDAHATDRAAVRALATTVDDVYGAIYETLHVALPTEEKLRFIVEPRVVSTLASSGTSLRVTSPTLYRIPHNATTTERLAELVAGHLVSRGLNEAMNVSELYDARSWYNVVMGVRSWLLGEVLGQPPYWRAPGFAQLRQVRQQVPYFYVSDLTDRGQIDTDHRLVRQSAAELLVMYAVETYGQDMIPDLVRGFRQYKSWGELIPAVFGVAVDEFERGWNGYVDEILE